MIQFTNRPHAWNLTGRYRRHVREKAIMRLQAQLQMAGRRAEDFDPNDLEVLVHEQESQLKASHREKAIGVAMSLAGLCVGVNLNG